MLEASHGILSHAVCCREIETQYAQYIVTILPPVPGNSSCMHARFSLTACAPASLRALAALLFTQLQLPDPATPPQAHQPFLYRTQSLTKDLWRLQPTLLGGQVCAGATASEHYESTRRLTRALTRQPAESASAGPALAAPKVKHRRCFACRAATPIKPSNNHACSATRGQSRLLPAERLACRPVPCSRRDPFGLFATSGQTVGIDCQLRTSYHLTRRHQLEVAFWPEQLPGPVTAAQRLSANVPAARRPLNTRAGRA
ncbi:hypothetical protein Q7P37_005771 [Cladosporium fusiforme]